MMKILLLAAALASLLTVGCGPDKQKACEGCTDTDLRDCEIDYEECDNIKHCKHSDIKHDWSEGICAAGD